MKSILPIFLIVFSINCFAQVQQWASIYNGPSGYDDIGYSLVLDASGNVYITGWSYAIGANDDGVTVKYNSAGVQQWVQRYNGPYSSSDQFYSLALDNSSNVYTAGYSTRSSTLTRYLVIKYNSSGVQQWVSVADTGKARSVALDTAGFIYVTGTSTSSSPYVTKKYDAAGTVVWSRIYGYGRNSFNPHLVCDLSGNIYVGGTAAPGYSFCLIKYNPAGDSLWVRKYVSAYFEDYNYALTTDNSGNIILEGTSWGGSSTGYDILTIKYSSAGVLQWTARYNDPVWGQDFGWGGITTDNSGNIYVTGSTEDGMSLHGDIITIKYNPFGVQQWVARYNGSSSGVEYSWSITADSSGNSYITGSSPANFSSGNLVTIKYNTSGVQQWVASYNGTANDIDVGYSVKTDNNGNVYVTGGTRNTGTMEDIVTIKYSQPVSISPLSNEIPSSFALYQNYPNPFNPSTKIKFDVAVSQITPAKAGFGNNLCYTSLKIYDILGREVVTLVNENLKQGSYEVDWSRTLGIPSGVYFYRLSSGDFSESKRMMLIK